MEGVVFLISVTFIIGVILIIAAKTAKDKYTRNNILGMAVSILLSPIILTCGVVVDNEKIMLLGILGPISLFFSVSVINLLIRYFKCTTMVIGKYLGAKEASRYKGNVTYAPMFSYSYNGKNYKVQSFFVYTEITISRKYKPNTEYEICINPSKPDDVVDKRFFPSNLLIMIGVVIMFAIVLTAIVFAM